MTKLPSVCTIFSSVEFIPWFALLFCLQPSVSLFSTPHPTLSMSASPMPYPCIFLCLPASPSEAAFLLLSLTPPLPDLQFTCHSQDGVA